MSITLAQGATTIELQEDLHWVNEFDWAPVEQAQQRSITGALLVSTAARIAGRPITLAPTDEGSAWTTRAALEQARDWAAVAGLQMTLSFRGVPHTVIFDHAATALTVTPVVHFNDADASDWFHVTYKFLEVA